jgi:hypothetical protein
LSACLLTPPDNSATPGAAALLLSTGAEWMIEKIMQRGFDVESSKDIFPRRNGLTRKTVSFREEVL